MTDVVEVLGSPLYDGPRRRSYVALDAHSWNEASTLIGRFGDAVDGYKVGLELFHAVGQQAVEKLCNAGKRVFLDVKLHDIPHTVAQALTVICQYPIEMVNVHTLGGPAMLEAARQAVSQSPYQPLLVGVTILTSMTAGDLASVGLAEPTEAEVGRLAQLALRSGLDGVVASAQEIETIRRVAPERFEIVVPGTRMKGMDRHDQARTATPGEAVSKGASRLVLGRAVTQSAYPLMALQRIWDDMLMGAQPLP